MQPIFCPQCDSLILDQPACPACGWQRRLEIGDAGQEVWRAELGRALPKPQCSAVVGGGRYCLVAEDGTISALDLASGRLEWERQIEAGHATYTLATDGALLLVSSVDVRPLPVAGKLFLALDMRTGADVWQYATAGHSLSAATIVDETAYFSSSDGMLHAVDTTTGLRRWQTKHPSWGPGTPAAGNGVVCVGGRRDMLNAYAIEDGTARWSFCATGWFAGPLSIYGGRVYAPCWDGNLYVTEAQNGQLLWTYQGERGEGITSPPSVAGSRAFIGSRVYRNTLAQQDKSYALLALQADDGSEIWRFFTERHIFVPPAVVGDTVFFGTDDGLFYALDAATGTERWKAELGGRTVTQPQIAGDLVYTGERRGTVYALGWRSRLAEQIDLPNRYLLAGEYEQAAIAHALNGDLAAAADLYERQLRRPREAAQLYERADESAKAAALWEHIGELRRARDLYQAAGNELGVARMLESMGEPLQAAHAYEEIGSLEDAARLYEQSGDRMRAAELYHKQGRFGQAAAIWETLGEWERLVEDLVAGQKPGEAARILEQQGQFERAAELYEAATALQPALALRVRLEHWERVADLAFRAGDYAQEAAAHERLGNYLSAAGACERVADQNIASEPINEEHAAAYFERAAQLYSAALDEEHATRCHRQVSRYRHLPEIAISGGAQNAFVEYEWNTLRLRVRNTGYGPATNITTALRGAFDIDGNDDIARLAPKKTMTLDVSVRPQRDQYGPAVPLEIIVMYNDPKGGQHSVKRRIPIRVTQKGATPGTTTPLEIDIRGDRPLRNAERAKDLSSQSTVAELPAIITANQEEIEQQQSLLATYRRTLVHLVGQAAQYGGEGFAPPHVANNISEARDNIRRIKDVLRDWGVIVTEQPDDKPNAN
jgi:outer membrane protein assembly factor BamB/tetratricopeptide (TPR) repeat protein